MSDSFVTPWTAAHQVPLSMKFPGQEHWNWFSFPSPGELPDPGVEPQISCIAGGFFAAEPPNRPLCLG